MAIGRTGPIAILPTRGSSLRSGSPNSIVRWAGDDGTGRRPELLRIPGTTVVLAGRSVPQLQAGIRPISLGLAPPIEAAQSVPTADTGWPLACEPVALN